MKNFYDELMKFIFLGVVGWVAVSVTELNKNVAVVVSQLSNHEKRIDINEVKIHGIETKIK